MILPPQKEAELVRSMEQAITAINAGDHPNTAIEKVALEHQYTPPFIDRMVQGINRSMAVAFMQGNPNKTASHPLAEVTEIVRKIYADDIPTQKVAVELPRKDFSALGFEPQLMDKTASERDPELRPRRLREIKATLMKHATFMDKAVATASQKVANSRMHLQDAITVAVQELRKLPRHQLNKVAQTVMNGYPETGGNICAIVRNFGIPLPTLQKTSNHCLFPAEPVYGALSEIDKHARLVVDAEQMTLRVKEAAEKNKVLMGSFLGNAAAELLQPGGDAGKNLSSEAELLEMADPAVLNKIKENEARTAMMKLVLYDKDLAHYPFRSLLKAYNDSVSSNPESYQYPQLLKNLMLQQLEGGEVKDLQTLKAESEVLKNLVGARREQTELART